VFAPIGTNDYKVAGGLAYAVPNVVTVVAGYRMVNEELWVSADVKAVKGLVARVGFRNVGGVTPKSYIYATAGTSSLVKDVNLGVDADYNLTDSKFGVRGMVEYSMKPYAIGLQANYDNGDAWYGVNGFAVNPYVKWGFSAGTLYAHLTYNAVTGKITLPLEFELSF
jgi:hypothetical protein